MKSIIYYAQTKETSIIDVPDVEQEELIPTIQEPTVEERLKASEDTLVALMELLSTLM